jgi:rhodanese-related sulfurtransferase
VNAAERSRGPDRYDASTAAGRMNRIEPPTAHLRSRTAQARQNHVGGSGPIPFARCVHAYRPWLPGILFLVLALASARAASTDVPSLSPADAAARIAAGTAVLVDVREPDEWNDTGVAAPAHLLALSDLRGKRKLWKPFLEANADKELIFYCGSGYRAGQVAQLLRKEGFKVANAGGFDDWIGAGQPSRKADEPARTP